MGPAPAAGLDVVVSGRDECAWCLAHMHSEHLVLGITGL
jgi:hypothetical protein